MKRLGKKKITNAKDVCQCMYAHMFTHICIYDTLMGIRPQTAQEWLEKKP